MARGAIGQNLSYLKPYSGRVLIDAFKQAEVPVQQGTDLRCEVISDGTAAAYNGDYLLLAKEPFEVKNPGGSPIDILKSAPDTYIVRLRANPGQTAQIHLLFPGRTALPAGVRLIRPGYSAEQADTQVFTNECIGLLAKLGAGVLREMDYGRINGNEITTWESRCQVTDPIWGVKGKGGPIEPVVDLCNRLDADLWTNIPAKADDGYVRNKAILIRDRLNAGLRVFVEYANEFWNDAAGFPQGAWMQEQGNKLATTDNEYFGAGPTTRRRMFYARRAKAIDAIFRDVFRGQESRVQTMLAGQTGDSSVLRDCLAYWPECQVVAQGGYFNTPAAAKTADEAVAGLADSARAVYWGTQFQKFNATAGNRLKLIYEWSNSTPEALAPGVNTDPRVAAGILMAGLGQLANGIFAACHFVPLAAWGKYAATDEVGKWTPKCQALADVSAARPLPKLTLPPPDPRDVRIKELEATLATASARVLVAEQARDTLKSNLDLMTSAHAELRAERDRLTTRITQALAALSPQ
jgi:hypothetical protein